jgi:hypothetical protein
MLNMRTSWLLAMAMLGGGVAGSLAGCARQRPAFAEEEHVAADESKSPGTLAEHAAADGDSFRFPNDLGGKLLAELLPPSDRLPRLPADSPAGPRRFATPRGLEQAELTWPVSQADLPSSSLGVKARLPRLRPAPEESPLLSYLADPAPPERPQVVAASRVKQWSPDVSQPLPMPILGQKQPESVSGDDPTADVTTAAALAVPHLQRSKPAPFLKLTLPEPYEHRQAVRLRKELAEDATPVTAAPRLPGK